MPRADGGDAWSEGMGGELAEDYESYGWATGKHAAREMVLGIKSQVLTQAEQFRGR